MSAPNVSRRRFLKDASAGTVAAVAAGTIGAYGAAAKPDALAALGGSPVRANREENRCPSNDRLAQEGVWLPQYVFLGDKKDMDDIADAVAKIHDHRDQLARL